MTQTYWSARHVGTRSRLPAKLTKGRAYFIEDEQVIVVDHGKGAITYGSQPGPQGEPGEPLPFLQEQIDNLDEASLNTIHALWVIYQIVLNKISELDDDTARVIDDISQTISSNAQTAQDYTDALEGRITSRLDTTDATISSNAQAAQDYTDTLRADLTTLHTRDLSHIHLLIADTDNRLQDQIDNLADALLKFMATTYSRIINLEEEANEEANEVTALRTAKTTQRLQTLTGQEIENMLTVGGWTLDDFKGGNLPQKVQTAFSAVTSDLLGVQYVPLLYIGSQVVNGVNYCLIAQQSLVLSEPRKHIVKMIINESSDGTYKLVDVVSIGIDA